MIRIRLRLGLISVAALVSLLVTSATAAAATVPEAKSFPPTRTGAESTMTVSFAAEGGTELMGAALLDGDASFGIVSDTCSGRPVVGECTIEVRFAPSTVGEHRAVLRLVGARGDGVVTLTGTAYTLGARLTASPQALTFQPLNPGSLSPPQSIRVSAGGDLPTSVASVAFEGPGRGDFVVTADGCSRTTLVPGTSCVLEVRANPAALGGSVARLRLQTEPADASVTIGMTLRSPPTLTPPPPPPTLRPPPWSFGIVAARYTHHRTMVRFYSSLPATISATFVRGRRSIRRVHRRIAAGSVTVIVRKRLRPGVYRIRVVARRQVARRPDSLQFRVR